MIDRLAQHTGTTVEALMGSLRLRPLVRQRMALARHFHRRGFSYREIALRLGKAKTSIPYLIQQAEVLHHGNAEFAALCAWMDAQ